VSPPFFLSSAAAFAKLRFCRTLSPPIMKVVFHLLAVVVLVVACDACKCAPTSVQGQYYSPEFTRVVRAVVRAQQRPSCTGVKGCNVLYKIRVIEAFKGCLSPTHLTVSTADNSAACGVNLKVGTEYLLYLTSDSVPTVGLCQGIQRYSDVTAVDRKFLETRQVCCNGQCKCSSKYQVFNCFVQPCKFAKPPCKDAVKCVDNYCGGCFAEWFTNEKTPACVGTVIIQPV
jgi:hypothetical protein